MGNGRASGLLAGKCLLHVDVDVEADLTESPCIYKPSLAVGGDAWTSGHLHGGLQLIPFGPGRTESLPACLPACLPVSLPVTSPACLPVLLIGLLVQPSRSEGV